MTLMAPFYISNNNFCVSSLFDNFPVSTSIQHHCGWFPLSQQSRRKIGFGKKKEITQIMILIKSLYSLGLLHKMEMGPLQQGHCKNQMKNWNAITSLVLVCSRCSIKVSLSLLSTLLPWKLTSKVLDYLSTNYHFLPWIPLPKHLPSVSKSHPIPH